MTEKAPKQITDLVTQLQQAHRLATGFYQRILPLFDEIAEEALYTEFWYWNPTETSRPCGQFSPPPVLGHGIICRCLLRLMPIGKGMAIKRGKVIRR